ncbi:LacI family DNA-binding transcriptional regulator [Yinghuangia seranimata]|uniref:LacI family DNA-binding transcriptional regulator n=1 Tax=Yinghuangia seranimata TaxID=408067 RepID=UPI00248C994F|nr:LacI family DNA-binding transcriptional regulator [Yinghuangia seranimata]MDI2129413.1 LacI family DNA-binding transcriptional regulator [Yinghuangia seranimata]
MPESAPPRRVTAADIARTVGVSRATVGFVLNNTPGQTISEGTRARVMEAAARLGYRPNKAATALAGGRSRIVLLMLPDWPADFSVRTYLEEASRALDEAGYSLVTQTHSAARVARPLWEALNPDVVIGWARFDDDDVASMRAAGITRIVPRPDVQVPLDEAPGVAEGARLQVDHLCDLGHRRLAFAAAADPRIGDLVQARASAAERQAGVRGVDLVDVRAVAHADGSAAEAVRDWRAAGVTGVVAYNDDVAAAVVGAAVRAGLRVPGDLAVIGHDDSPLAALFVPSLSSVRMDAVQAGRFLAELALREAEDRPISPMRYEPETHLVVRESTAGETDVGIL